MLSSFIPSAAGFWRSRCSNAAAAAARRFKRQPPCALQFFAPPSSTIFLAVAASGHIRSNQLSAREAHRSARRESPTDGNRHRSRYKPRPTHPPCLAACACSQSNARDSALLSERGRCPTCDRALKDHARDCRRWVAALERSREPLSLTLPLAHRLAGLGEAAPQVANHDPVEQPQADINVPVAEEEEGEVPPLQARVRELAPPTLDTLALLFPRVPPPP